MLNVTRLGALCAAAAIFAGAAGPAPASAGNGQECTSVVTHTPEHHFQFTEPGRFGHDLTLLLDMDADLGAVLGGDGALEITSSILEGDGLGQVTLTPSGELVLLATGEESWIWSYRLSETYGTSEEGDQAAELACEDPADIPI